MTILKKCSVLTTLSKTRDGVIEEEVEEAAEASVVVATESQKAITTSTSIALRERMPPKSPQSSECYPALSCPNTF
jgi:hypothetical protein